MATRSPPSNGFVGCVVLPACLALLTFAWPAVALQAGRLPASGAEGGVDLSTVHVAYATTVKGFPGLLRSMLSLARSMPASEWCTIHLVVPSEELQQAEGLARCFELELANLTTAPALNVSLHAMPHISWAMRKAHRLSYTELTFAGFYLHSLLPESVPRVIMLNPDTIVRANVGALYRTPMSHPVAVAYDNREWWPETVKQRFPGVCLDWWPQDLTFQYFNAGVYVEDLTRWRSGVFTQRLENISSKCLFHDQDALNYFFLNDTDRVDASWNIAGLGSALTPHPATIKSKIATPDMKSARILHWSGPLKPWREPPFCFGNLTARMFDPQCLGQDNRAFYDAHAPSLKCRALG